MKYRIDSKRFIISILIIGLMIFFISKFVSNIFSKTNDINTHTESISGNSQEIINTYEPSQDYTYNKIEDRLQKVKMDLVNCDFFSDKASILYDNDVIQKLGLENFKDLTCISIVDVSKGYQEVVVVSSTHKEDYDELVRMMILRYQSIRDTSLEEYKDIIKNPENVSIKQENGIVSLIVSQNASSILSIIRNR